MLKPADIMGRVGLKPTAEEQRRRVALPEGRTSGCKRSKPLATLQPQPAHLIPATEGRTAGSIPRISDAELAEMCERAAKWVLTPAQAKAIDGRAGLLVRPDDGDGDPYFTRRF